MNRWLATATVLALVAAPVSAAGIAGHYMESRNCDIWTGPCFANAEMNLTGKNAILAWKINKGTIDDVRLDGLGVVAVVVASDTLGTKQTGDARAVLIVDSKANAAQQAALVRLARQQGGDLVKNVVAVQKASVELEVCECKEGACAKLNAGSVSMETRCIDAKHDKACGNESAFYPPLTKAVKVQPAMVSQHGFQGTGLGTTWKESDRRGAYVGSFEAY